MVGTEPISIEELIMPDRGELIRANAAIFERLLDWFPDIIQSVDADGNIVYANRQASEILGYSRDELLGMNISELYAPEMQEKVKAGFSKLQQQGSLNVCDSTLVAKAGERIPVEIRSFAVYDENSTFLRTFSILRDARDIKDLQDRLMHASRLASIGELASCIVHDIANPLSVIKLSGELLHGELEQLHASAADSTESLRDSLSIVEQAADKIQKIIDHLRNLARANDVEPEHVDLRQTMEGAIFMVNNKLQKGRIDVDQDYPDSPCWVVGHGIQIEQVFMNLISNACDAMQETDSPLLRVSIRSLPPIEPGGKPVWGCTVADNGGGIAPEDRERVFNSFFTTKEKGEGTGLGLAIVHSIVHKHGGDIQLDSELSAGTTFRVLLPASDAPEVSG